MKRRYRPDPTRQRVQAHRKRKAFNRASAQILAMRRPWMRAWEKSQYGRGPVPQRIKVPKMLKHRKVDLYRKFTAVGRFA